MVYRCINPPLTPLMILRLDKESGDRNNSRIQKDWLNINNHNINILTAVFAAEDNNFVTHWGFELSAIRHALRHNKNAKIVRGASTISQQTAKNVFLWPSRSWVRKGLEGYFTLLIESFWGKQRILEVYLNVVEMGDSIYGMEKASRVYFSKSAADLSKKEAALLAGILPGPLLWNPHKPSPRMFNRQQIVLRNMKHIGKIRL